MTHERRIHIVVRKTKTSGAFNKVKFKLKLKVTKGKDTKQGKSDLYMMNTAQLQQEQKKRSKQRQRSSILPIN